jgi:N6-L-threonylcarbamoyladenine synthase
MKLKTLPMCDGLSGGRAIELVARDGNVDAFDFFPVMSQLAHCNFSFAGIKAWALRTIEKEEAKYGKTNEKQLNAVWQSDNFYDGFI